MGWRDQVHTLREVVEERTGLSVQPRERMDFLEEAVRDRRVLARQLEDLAYTALNYRGSDKRELKPEERRKLVEKGWIVWRKDAMAGAAIDLMNEFVWGRGMVKPKAVDEQVQEVIDEFWADPDNEEILTKLDAQLALGVDLEVQCNVFMLVFDDGGDGKVKLGILEHDSVERAVRWHQKRQRVLYYLAYEWQDEFEWDYERDQPKLGIIPGAAQPLKRSRYYKHWRNVEVTDEECDAAGIDAPAKPPEAKMGDGLVFHLRINRGSEMVFGHPRIDRLIRWYSAYNRFLEDRLDVMHAKAAYIMERQVKGSQSQLDKIASKSLSVVGELGGGDGVRKIGPEGAANILDVNEQVSYRELSLDTGSAAAEGDGRMIRSPISASTSFPPTYYGDMSAGTLATATSLELPVLKAVETRQEFWEGLVRFAVDRAIEKAVDSGRIKKELSADEIAAKRAKEGDAAPPGPNEPAAGPPGSAGEFGPPVAAQPPAKPAAKAKPSLALAAAGYEDQTADEEDTQRDLTYEFGLPNPLKRMLADVVTAVQTICQTFDPNNTNPELSRVMLTVALSELELDSVPEIVERIFPPGYEDPAQAAAMQAQLAGPQQPQGFGEFDPNNPTATGADGQQHGAGNPYGAPMRSPQPGQRGSMMQSTYLGRNGQPITTRIVLEEAAHQVVEVDAAGHLALNGEVIEEARYEDLPPEVLERHRARLAQVEREFDAELAGVVHRNGNGKG